MRKTIFVLLVFVFLASNIAFAANIEGTLYDNSLNVRGNVIVEINTMPKQSLVSKTGKYRFQVPLGNYTITARYISPSGKNLYARKSVLVNDYRDYVIDLILFPENKTTIEVPPGEEHNWSLWMLGVIAGIIIFLLVALLLYFILKKRISEPSSKYSDKTEDGKEEVSYAEPTAVYDTGNIVVEDVHEDVKLPVNSLKSSTEVKNSEISEDLQKIIQIIKDEGGRTTQKQIRKFLPYSEAKVSLMITELIEKGYIEKIKRGRGNIIILKKSS